MKIYIDWDHHEAVNDKLKDACIEYHCFFFENDEQELQDFLEANYNIVDILKISDSDRREILKKFKEAMMKKAQDYFRYNFEQITLPD